MMTPPLPPTSPAQGETDADRQKSRTHRLYDLDSLLEKLVSGRVGDGTMEPQSALLMLGLLDCLEWSVDLRAFVGALPHFPRRFGLQEIRTTMRNLGYGSRTVVVPASRLGDCPGSTLVACEGHLWFIDASDAGTALFRPTDDHFSYDRRPAQAGRHYTTIQFEPRNEAANKREQQKPRTSWFGEMLLRM
ncbi:MAG: hypothetical protein AAFX00_11480, partial [Pseudomonadota bacterium]